MFVVEVVAALTTLLFLRDLATGGSDLFFSGQIILWLWFTLLFANFAEALAEGRGKAQAESLRRTRTEMTAKRLTGGGELLLDRPLLPFGGGADLVGGTTPSRAAHGIPRLGASFRNEAPGFRFCTVFFRKPEAAAR